VPRFRDQDKFFIIDQGLFEPLILDWLGDQGRIEISR
jgi:hypothetical protein